MLDDLMKEYLEQTNDGALSLHTDRHNDADHDDFIGGHTHDDYSDHLDTQYDYD